MGSFFGNDEFGKSGFDDILGDLSKGIKEMSDNNLSQSIKQGKEIDSMFDRKLEFPSANEKENENELKKEAGTQKVSSEKTKKEETTIVQTPAMTPEEAMEKLNGLIGLEDVKTKVVELVESLKGEKLLAEKTTLKLTRPNLHMVFSGPPGTGKTEVARILANVLHALGFVKENKLIETDRSGLVSSHAGGTAAKVMEKFEAAEGGILFIDEAYALANGDQYGKEAIDTVIKAMEDKRESVLVILAGYEAEMENLLRQNPGFKSRIPNKFNFKDYNALELTEIAKAMLSSKGYVFDQIEPELKAYISINSVNGALEGNGRTIRNLVEGITLQHKIRIGKLKNFEGVELKKILVEDIKNAIAPKNNQRKGMEEVKILSQKMMDSMIDIEKTKNEIENFLNYSIIQNKKIKDGANIPMPSLNLVFKGGNGTGKTEMARNVAMKLRAYGVLNNGQVKEVSRGDIIGSVIGATAQNVKNLMAQSVGGVLVIDRIESLDSDDSYSQEAISVLLQEIDKYRGKMALIITGSGEAMEKFMNKNEALKNKMNKTIVFEDYSTETLVNILEQKLKMQIGLELDEDSRKKIKEHLAFLMPIRENAHWVNQFIENLQIAQCNRLIREESEEYQVYKTEDITNAIDMM